MDFERDLERKRKKVCETRSNIGLFYLHFTFLFHFIQMLKFETGVDGHYVKINNKKKRK